VNGYIWFLLFFNNGNSIIIITSMSLLEKRKEFYKLGEYGEAIKCFDQSKDANIYEILEGKSKLVYRICDEIMGLPFLDIK
jgi:hypothetical protein